MASINPYGETYAAIARNDNLDLNGDYTNALTWRGQYDYTLNGSNNNAFYANYVRYQLSDIVSGATINSAYLYYTVSAQSSGTIYVRIYAEDAGDPALPTSDSTFTDGSRTSASIDYNFTNLSINSTYYLNVTSIVQEVVNRYDWYPGNHINIIMAEYTVDLNAYSEFHPNASHLSIDYTNPVSAPSVTTETSYSANDTAATLYGNITDTGGENPSRHIQYGSSAGNYNTDCNAGTGGTGSYSCSFTGLNPNTVYHFQAWAENSGGTSYGSDETFTTTASPPSVSTGTDTETETTATLYGNVTDTGGEDPDRYIEYGTTTSYGSSCSAGNGGTGSYSCSISGLSAGTEYHYRAKAINSGGTSYGSDDIFYTKPYAPTNLSATGVSQTEIDLTWTKGSGAQGTIIRYDTSGYPTSTIDGASVYSGTGTSCSHTALSCGTTYYYSAWAYSGDSDSSNYDTDSGVTYACVVVPTVTTQAVSNIGKLTATGNGTITDDGGATTTKGMCWNTTGSPTISDSHNTNGTGTGSYSVAMTGLSKDQTYYVKAYGTNSAGTSYGGEVSFTTKYGILKRYNGSSWVTTPLKVYNSGWLNKPLKIYNGSWKEVETSNT